jgi:hypothetical protein
MAALVLIAMWMYLNHRIAIASPGGVDFLTHWVGTRALFNGESPYSNEVAIRVQDMVYGRPAQPGENEFLDPYLLYAEVIFAPFALISDYVIARAAWMTFLELATLAIFILSLQIVGWKPGIPSLCSYLLYGILGYHSIRPIMNGNVTTVITLIIVGTIWAIQNRKDGLAGVLMAFALAKPNLTALPALFLIVWMISVGRWRFIIWLSGSFVLLVLGGMLIIPDWPMQNLLNTLRYNGYNPPTTVAAALDYFIPGIGHWIGIFLYGILMTLLIRRWVKALQKGFPIFLFAFALTLVVGQWLGISTDPGNFILLTLPLALVLKPLDKVPHASIWIPALLGLLLIGLWVLFLASFDPSRANLQSPIMFFPLPIFLLIGFYFSQRSGKVVAPLAVDKL